MLRVGLLLGHLDQPVRHRLRLFDEQEFALLLLAFENCRHNIPQSSPAVCHIDVQLSQERLRISRKSANQLVRLRLRVSTLHESESHLLYAAKHALDGPATELARVVVDLVRKHDGSLGVEVFVPGLAFFVPFREHEEVAVGVVTKLRVD